ncbi:MAG: shikimate kinase [Pyrinomonadaceae bacterium]
MKIKSRIILTGFMGVGKTTVSRFLAQILQTNRLDLDWFIESNEGRKVQEIIKADGIEKFREVETENLRRLLATTDAPIVSLGGGAWIMEINRQLIKNYDCTTIWLESTFEHCWRNLSMSKKSRPLILNRQSAQNLFEERQRIYCLSDWHFIVKPHLTSYEIAHLIVEEVLG